MARPTKTQLRNIGEYASVYRWNISFTDPPSAVDVPDNFNALCVSTALPKKEANQMIEIKIRGHTIRRPGIMDDSHQIQLTFVETVDNQISNFLKTWRDALWEPDTGVQQDLSAVTSTLQIIRLDNQDNPIWRYDLHGCFLEDYDPVGAELGADVEAVRPTLTLYYDSFTDEAI